MKLLSILLCFGLILILPSFIHAQSNNRVLLKQVRLIDGTGKPSVAGMDLLIQGDTIAAIGHSLSAKGAKLIDLKGKTMMPALISAHTHIGALKGTTVAPENYTRENILRQLKKYEDYGVSTILVMGTDRPLMFQGLRDSSVAGLLPGARCYSAGYGFGTPSGGPKGAAMDKIFRPATPEEARADVQQLHQVNPTVVKMWVDDFGGSAEKMKPEIYREIIRSAHSYNMRVASHLYYLEDARSLVEAGVDLIAHSIRDKDIDDTLLRSMKEKQVVYIPTLSLDEFAFIYARKPDWIDDPFFKASLEPGVYEMITSKEYQDGLKNSPAYQKNIAAFETALRNLKKIFDAGILVALGTDSGAFPVRTQGFSEHLELELMVQAGLRPLDAITVATKNAAVALRIDKRFGTLEKGKLADFIILGANPEENIKNTRRIESVWKAGVKVSDGPLSVQ